MMVVVSETKLPKGPAVGRIKRTDRGESRSLYFDQVEKPVVEKLDAIARALGVTRAFAFELLVDHQQLGEDGLPVWVQEMVAKTQLPLKVAA
jgi:hypothetical protein